MSLGSVFNPFEPEFNHNMYMTKQTRFPFDFCRVFFSSFFIFFFFWGGGGGGFSGFFISRFFYTLHVVKRYIAIGETKRDKEIFVIFIKYP